MKHRCLIIDDEELGRELIERHLSQLPELTLVHSCSSALEARQVLKNEQIDLLFLDIEMPVLKGTDFLKSLSHSPKVIFTTAHREYAVEGFELNAVDYLLKPITFERFIRAVEKYLTQHSPSEQENLPPQNSSRKDHIFIRKDRKKTRLELSEIRYVESLRDYVKIWTHAEEFQVKYSLAGFQELLDDRFIRIHRSFIVNLDAITAFTKQDVEIGSTELPIGDLYRKKVERVLG